ncbi:MAG TPA: dienelactone hydrolase family protein [Actinomycetales bacterium]|nr:dienelactone hydrolase family protein [Actinomycetales bacterium]
MTTAPDVLAGWVATPFSAAGATHDVYRKGTGPGVVLLPEAPGMTPEVLGLAEHLVDSGFTVAAPSLFGTPGRPISVGYAAGTMARVCISREFAAFARRADRPVAEYVRALARELHADVGGRGVGVIGMCFTGGFALAAAVEPAVLAPVASQPSVPFPLGSRKEDLGMSDRERDAVVRRVREDGLCALGLRFSEDRFVPRQRFERLTDLLGDGWRVIEIDSSPGNPHGVGRHEHSVITSHDVGMPGHPVTAARDEVVAFLHERLQDG